MRPDAIVNRTRQLTDSPPGMLIGVLPWEKVASWETKINLATLDTSTAPAHSLFFSLFSFPSPLYSSPSLYLCIFFSHLFIMRSSIVLLSALATAVMGANSTEYTLPEGFNLGLVDSSERSM